MIYYKKNAFVLKITFLFTVLRSHCDLVNIVKKAAFNVQAECFYHLNEKDLLRNFTFSY